ncbi:LuxR family transcriptional regulator [Streptomyces violaceusniger]
MLKERGLEWRAVAVYRLSLVQPSLDVGEIARRLDLSEAEVRAIHAELAEHPLVAGRASLTCEDSGLRGELGPGDDLMSRRWRIAKARSMVSSMTRNYEAGEECVGAVRRFDGVDAVHTRLRELCARAAKECRIFSSSYVQLPNSVEQGNQWERVVAERGISIRAVHQDSFRGDSAELGAARWLASLGGRIRTVPVLPTPMALVDEHIALVPLDPEDATRGALELNGYEAVAALRTIFEHFWVTATPWDEPAQRDREGLSPRERDLLRLLASGFTDESMCRKLGISLRTVRRAVADLMARLGAHSRFEAGVQAVRCGWL